MFSLYFRLAVARAEFDIVAHCNSRLASHQQEASSRSYVPKLAVTNLTGPLDRGLRPVTFQVLCPISKHFLWVLYQMDTSDKSIRIRKCSVWCAQLRETTRHSSFHSPNQEFLPVLCLQAEHTVNHLNEKKRPFTLKMCYKYKTFQKLCYKKPHTHTDQPLKKEKYVIKAKLCTLLNCPTISAVAFCHLKKKPKHLECRHSPDCGLLKTQETALSSFTICPFCVWCCMFLRANAANIMW